MGEIRRLVLLRLEADDDQSAVMREEAETPTAEAAASVELGVMATGEDGKPASSSKLTGLSGCCPIMPYRPPSAILYATHDGKGQHASICRMYGV